jgi:hypothetical protein
MFFFILSCIFWIIGLIIAMSGDDDYGLGSGFIMEWIIVKCQGWVYSLIFSYVIYQLTVKKGKEKFEKVR